MKNKTFSKIKQAKMFTLSTLGMMIAGVTPAFATTLSVSSLQSSNLDSGVTNVKKGVASGAETALTIILDASVVLGVVILLWGLHMAFSKDTRDEGKMKDGIKLAMLGLLFISVGFVIKKVAGLS